jgi:hypothetical protein
MASTMSPATAWLETFRALLASAFSRQGRGVAGLAKRFGVFIGGGEAAFIPGVGAKRSHSREIDFGGLPSP